MPFGANHFRNILKKQAEAKEKNDLVASTDNLQRELRALQSVLYEKQRILFRENITSSVPVTPISTPYNNLEIINIEIKPWQTVAYSPTLKLFVILASSDGTSPTNRRLATSSDGTNWTVHSNATMNQVWQRMIWCPTFNFFIAVAFGGIVGRSSNGIDWTLTTVAGGTGIDFTSIAWSAKVGRFCTGRGTQMPYNSPDGINWTICTGAGSGRHTFISVNDTTGRFISVDGQNQTTPRTRIHTSDDGINFVGANFTATVGGNQLASNAWQNVCSMVEFIPRYGAWYIGTRRGENNQRLWRSLDNGATFTPITTPVAFDSRRIEYSSRYDCLILVNFPDANFSGADNIKFYFSRDGGLSWTNIPFTDSLARISSLAISDEQGLYIATSIDGTQGGNAIRLIKGLLLP